MNDILFYIFLYYFLFIIYYFVAMYTVLLFNIFYLYFFSVKKVKIYNNIIICSICLDNIESNYVWRIIDCKCIYYYHYKCIINWLFNKYECPICRHKLIK